MPQCVAAIVVMAYDIGLNPLASIVAVVLAYIGVCRLQSLYDIVHTQC